MAPSLSERRNKRSKKPTARPRTRVTVEDLSPPEPEDEAPLGDPAGPEPSESLAPPPDGLDELEPGSGFVNVFYVSPQGAKEFLRRVDRSLVADDLRGFIGRTWHGGDYHVDVYRKDENGTRFQTRKDVSISIREFGPHVGAATAATEAADPYRESAESELRYYEPPAPGVPAAPAPQGTGLASVLIAMQQNTTALMQSLQAANERHAAAQAASQEKIFSIIMESIKAGRPATASIDETIRVAQVMGKNSGLGEEVVRALVMKTLGEDSGGKTPISPNDTLVERLILKVVDAVGPALAAMLPKLVAMAAPGPRPTQRPAVSAPAAIAASAPAAPEPTPPAEAAEPAPAASPELVVAQAVSAADTNGHAPQVDMKAIVKAYPMYGLAVGAVVAMARGNMDVQKAAEKIDVIAGEENQGVIEALIALDDEMFIAELASYEPSAAEFRPWLLQVKAALDALYDAKPEPEPAGGSGGVG